MIRLIILTLLAIVGIWRGVMLGDWIVCLAIFALWLQYFCSIEIIDLSVEDKL